MTVQKALGSMLSPGKTVLLAVLSAVAGAFFLADIKTIYSGDIFGSTELNYIRDFAAEDIVIWLAAGALIFMLALLLGLAYIYAGNNFKNRAGWEKPAVTALFRRRGRGALREGAGELSCARAFLFCFGVLLLLWLPYLLTYMPGAVFADGFASIKQVLNGTFSNHHPILYTFFVGVCIRIGELLVPGSINAGIAVYTAVQTAIMAAVMAYSIVWLYKKGIRAAYCAACLLFIALFPLFPYYAVATWKDTLFSLALYLYALCHADIMLSRGECLSGVKGAANYLILTFFVCFLRNNGIYVCLFSLVLLAILYHRVIKKNLWRFLLCAGALLALTLVIQGPVYSALGLSTEFAESVSVPNQQIFAVFSDDEGVYTQEEADFISNIWDIDEIKEKYTPSLADTPKAYMSRFDREFLERHKAEYFKVWIGLAAKNPKIIINAWLLDTMSFWSPSKGGPEAYVQLGVWPNDYKVEQIDVFKSIFGWSFGDIVQPRSYMSIGLPFWLFILFFAVSAVCSQEKKWIRRILPALPALAVWLTVMIASPIAVSLRYAYIFVLLLPFLPAVPCLSLAD